MKNYEAIKLFQFLAGPVGASLKMKYKTRLELKKNIKVLGELYQSFTEIEAEKNTKVPLLEEFQEDLLNQGADFFQKDDDGKVITLNGTANALPGKLPEIEKLRETLSNLDKYKETVATQAGKEEEWKELLETDIDFDIVKLSIEGFEEPDLTTLEWSIFELILEEE